MKHIPIILLCLVVFLFIKKRFFDTTDYKLMIEQGAIIVDVRSESEFLTGNISGSLNIPLGDIDSNLNQLKDKDRIIITCCASGIRSAGAKKILESYGYTNVINGGGWSTLNSKIN